MFTQKMSREEIIKFLTTVRTDCLCAYGKSTICDCKYGADRIGKYGESGCGCPEMRNIILMFQLMPDNLFSEVSNYAWKEVVKYNDPRKDDSDE